MHAHTPLTHMRTHTHMHTHSHIHTHTHYTHIPHTKHRNHVVHRDLKAENVFFVTPSHVKVGDFGFSIQSNSPTLNTFCGSPPYAAPELFLEQSYCGPMVDVWALGILLYFMLTGTLPFKGQTIPLLKAQILEGQYHMPSDFSPSCQDLISSILTGNPQERPDAHTITVCPWLQGCTREEEGEGGCATTVGPIGSGRTHVDADILKLLESWGVPPSELRQVALLTEPRTSAEGAYRILAHRKRNNVPLAGNSDTTAMELPTSDRLLVEKRQDKRHPSSKYCGIL